MEVRAFDIFCGAGGSSCGARQAGATIVGGIDLWPLATRTFQLNFPQAKVYTANLTELDPHDVARDVGPIDLLLASPECTHHSVAKGGKPRDEASKRLAFEVVCSESSGRRFLEFDRVVAHLIATDKTSSRWNHE